MAEEKTVFDKIVEGALPSKKIWEDDRYVAFLTPFPNVEGFTVVVPKINPGSNYLDVSDDKLTELVLAAKKVATKIRKAYNINRVGLVIEGEGVPHLHVKLIPMTGQTDTSAPGANHTEFYSSYPGYLTTIDGPEMESSKLDEVQKKIQDA